MDTIILILKGFLIGIGKIIPGVSGSLIAVALNIYDKLIEAVNHLFKNFYNNITFIGKVGIGILLSLILFSKVISYFLNLHYAYTMAVFIGLFLGVIPNVFNTIKYSKKDILINMILCIVVFLFSNINFSLSFLFQTDFKYIYIIILGFIDAVTMIIPGISGTAIYMLLDSYQFILDMYSNINFHYLLLFGIGLFIGIYLTIKLVSFMIREHNDFFHYLISYLAIYSILLLLINTFQYINYSNVVIFFLLVIINYKIARKLDNL